MILSSEEIEVLDYLKSCGGKFVTMIEICRSAGGRQRFRDNPHWAKRFMGRLVEGAVIEVNERGHYRWIDLANPPKPGQTLFPLPTQRKAPAPCNTPSIVGDNYFPASSSNDNSESEARWVSPQIAAILKKSGKKFPGQQ